MWWLVFGVTCGCCSCHLWARCLTPAAGLTWVPTHIHMVYDFFFLITQVFAFSQQWVFVIIRWFNTHGPKLYGLLFILLNVNSLWKFILVYFTSVFTTYSLRFMWYARGWVWFGVPKLSAINIFVGFLGVISTNSWSSSQYISYLSNIFHLFLTKVW